MVFKVDLGFSFTFSSAMLLVRAREKTDLWHDNQLVSSVGACLFSVCVLV